MTSSIFQLLESVFSHDNKSVKAYKDQENKHYLANRIPNIGILAFGTIAGNQTKRLDLGAKGIFTPVILRSVYAFSGATTNDEIHFNIFKKDSAGVLNKIATQRYDSNQMPYQFRYGATLTPDMVIEVKPRYNVDNLLVYVEPVNVMFSIDAN